MTRRTQAEATRDAVIASARQLWTTKGFFATSTADIVDHAQVGTRGAFYHHFKDREELFLAVFADVHAQLTTELSASAPDDVDPISRLGSSLKSFLEIISRSPDLQALLIDGPAVIGVKRWQELSQEYSLGYIEAHLTAAVGVGDIPDQPTTPLAQVLLMTVSAAALSVAAHDDPDAARIQVGNALVVLIEGLRRNR